MHRVRPEQVMDPGPQVGLAGPSGAGKTVFSQKVQSFIPGVG